MLVYELRVSLLGAEPAVWRRVRVPGDTHLRLVHLVLQMAMGWENRHLHEFVSADRKRYVDFDGSEPQADELDENMYTLKDLVSKPGDRCLYLYDFGDDWTHEIVLETVSEVEVDPAEQFRCLAGQGACPPEDCGGVPGYLELLEKFNDLDAVDHDEAVVQLGEVFDPEAFDCAFFNERVSAMFASHEEMPPSGEVDEEMGALMQLQDFLASEELPDSSMSIVVLDGFFAALAIHPVPIMPSAWLPLVWDMSGAGHQPEFASRKEAEKVTGLLFSYMNSVTQSLADGSADYETLFEILEIESGEERMLAAEDWATGFVAGAMIDQEMWTRTVSDEAGGELLWPFVIMSGLSDEQSGISEEKLAEIRATLIDDLNECVLDLRDFWAEWRREYLPKPGAGRTAKAPPRVGRNEPCPCGSGKKYKQCCGK
ncbi:hypothetical protein BIU88_04450 [Chlorobaculum limnaeum]|uniref:Plasmid pRiA4b Orf3-like domain-containing protein n=1 Tax=Chlorobaculum limnaeum TaxID=274537 RepID=A0A1D8CX13_CHLLM|nr:UPF0149 family protein [Chlorobaculum limnaeum]AOS83456.1 hypothetical protein BIU88_04450 [Chlorobaculum limnaeum]